jgi:hypothetical protein
MVLRDCCRAYLCCLVHQHYGVAAAAVGVLVYLTLCVGQGLMCLPPDGNLAGPVIAVMWLLAGVWHELHIFYHLGREFLQSRPQLVPVAVLQHADRLSA